MEVRKFYLMRSLVLFFAWIILASTIVIIYIDHRVLDHELKAAKQQIATALVEEGKNHAQLEADHTTLLAVDHITAETIKFRNQAAADIKALQDLEQKVDEQFATLQKKTNEQLRTIQKEIDEQFTAIQKKVDDGQTVCDRDLATLRDKIAEGKAAWDKAVKEGLPEIAKRLYRDEELFSEHIDATKANGHSWTVRVSQNEAEIEALKKTLKKDK